MCHGDLKRKLFSERFVEYLLDDKSSVVIQKNWLISYGDVFSYDVMIRVKMEESSRILVTYRFPEVAFDQAASLYENKSELLRQIPEPIVTGKQIGRAHV